jgi:predicted transcriptional regulator
MMQNDFYQPHVAKTLQTLADLGKSSFDRRWLKVTMGLSGSTISAVIYRMVRDGVVTEQRDVARYYRPSKPGSGQSTVAKQTQVTFVVKGKNNE